MWCVVQEGRARGMEMSEGAEVLGSHHEEEVVIDNEELR